MEKVAKNFRGYFLAAPCIFLFIGFRAPFAVRPSVVIVCCSVIVFMFYLWHVEYIIHRIIDIDVTKSRMLSVIIPDTDIHGARGEMSVKRIGLRFT